MNKFSILNGAKYFSPRIFQNYLVFKQIKSIINILIALIIDNICIAKNIYSSKYIYFPSNIYIYIYI